MTGSVPEKRVMPCFLSRTKRLSGNPRRLRNGQFDAPKASVKQQQEQQQQQQQQTTHISVPFPEERTTPTPKSSSPTLIVDSGTDSNSTAGNTRSVHIGSRDWPAESGSMQQLQQRQEHRRVVSLSWPGEYRLNPQLSEQDYWKQQLEPQDTTTTARTNISTTTTTTCVLQEEEGEEEDEGEAVKKAAVLPNKRQRQMAFKQKRASSGPIDIPPSPAAAAAAVAAAAPTGQDADNGNATRFYDYVDPWTGVHVATTSTLATGDEVRIARGGRAATDADAWYLCWASNRPDLDDDGNRGSVRGPPAHIIQWERETLSYRRARQLEEAGESSSTSSSHKRMPKEVCGDGGGGGCAAAPAATLRDQVMGEYDDDDDNGVGSRGPSDRRMLSDECGSVFEMDLEMSMRFEVVVSKCCAKSSLCFSG
ncbi:unnamed protein product [Pylaiella littoralis]